MTMDIRSYCITASDSGISYPSIFQLNLEIPAFFANYRWWEDEATTVFWAFDIQEISRVIQFGLFDDESVPRTSLCARNVDTIDTFLMALSEPHEYQFLGSLSHSQRVEEILRRSSISPFQAIPWSWLPPQSSPTLDALEIAAAIEAESHFHFRQIAFEEFARAALGYKAVFVEWFLQQHTALYIILRDHLSAYPGDIPLYTEVEKHLRSRSPFAHRALVHCLLAVQTGGPHHDMSKPHTAGFEFIAGPIQALFMGQQGRLTAMLKMLSVLAIRFRRQYIHPPTMDWKTPFDTSIPFLDDYLDSTSPADLARTMNGADEHLFAELTRESLITEDVVVGRLQTQWRTLSTSVWECCSALPDLIPYLQECAKTLLTTRNYHSLAAVIKGLHTYSILTTRTNKSKGNMITLEALIPQVLVALMDPAQNFNAYRDHYRRFPGIPFLMPHIHDFKQNGESILEPIFKHLQSTQ
ncbi:Guanine-nucleotide dissociation stimulator CDC25 [Penicillium griseofulvum]|uniref:Guanine-nucleotide dissociation stimulator CDC25 n=1 Tax=Penicillium patulum TaxID=5078 RepID=A0A135LAX2_PENPA|nr:Guanine-nucleotide dissociation stimulator CDC25 [Penicillium griseofulvum]KXG46106.1 Guanine-nucleotide dissociation stimulator CDC25 [Penicillium griseofulvum]